MNFYLGMTLKLPIYFKVQRNMEFFFILVREVYFHNSVISIHHTNQTRTSNSSLNHLPIQYHLSTLLFYKAKVCLKFQSCTRIKKNIMNGPAPQYFQLNLRSIKWFESRLPQQKLYISI